MSRQNLHWRSIAMSVALLMAAMNVARNAVACPACAAAATPGSCVSRSFHTGGDGEPLTMAEVTGAANAYDLGEAAPAQSGSNFAVLDQPGGYMIGDFFSNPYSFVTSNNAPVGDLSLAGGDRRFKISENTSPIPRDRVYFTFNHFKHAIRTVNDYDTGLNRYTFGGEKTFFDSLGSVEFRIPFAHGLAANQIQGGTSSDVETVFGNVTIIPKVVLGAGDYWLVSAGLGINLPTAPSSSAQLRTGELITVDNDATHLSPYLGMYLMPTSSTYVIGYIQADFDTGGNYVRQEYLGTTYSSGTLQDQTLLHADLAMGCWLYRNEQARLTGIAPQLELHYTTTLQDADGVRGAVMPVTNRFDTFTLTGGLNFQFYRSYLTLGCAVPLLGSDDQRAERPYDVEGQVLFNRFF